MTDEESDAGRPGASPVTQGVPPRAGLVARLHAFWDMVRARKVAQWGAGYLVAAFGVLQGTQAVAQTLDWSPLVARVVLVLLGAGFLIAIIIAWSHGERGRQRVTVTETALIAACVAGGLALAFVVTQRSVAARPPAPSSQLIAFFGITPTGGSPAVSATADAATDRMFEAMGGAAFLTSVARTETKGTPDDRRFARAAELGARYALAGEMRPDADGMTLSIRFEDVSSGVTLWEKSFTSPASDVAYLPAQAARQTVEVMWCIVKTRSELTHDTREILNLIADRCREGAGAVPRNVAFIVGRMRAVTEADPDGAYNQAQLVMMLGLSIATAPPFTQKARIAEAEAVLKRAARLDPNEAGVSLARIVLDQAKGVPVAELDATVLDAAAKAEGKDAFVFGDANRIRASILRTTGRFREALPHIVTAVAYDPLPAPWEVGLYRAVGGQRAEARADLEPALASYGAWVWQPLIPYAIFLDTADAGTMLQHPPSTIPGPDVDCLRHIRTALASRNAGARALGAKKANACGAAETLSPTAQLASLAALGDLDDAFALAEKQTFNASSLWSDTLQVLFWPTSRAMRADPRFLPLVETLGMMDYWRTTRSRPDICETEAAAFCRKLGAP